MTEPTPAGWYPDPENSAQQRYWDGGAWTENFAPANAAAVPAAVAAKKPFYKRTWFIVVAVLIGAAAIGGMIDGFSSEAPESQPTATESTPQPPDTEGEPAVAEPEPEPEPEPAQEPAEPALTMGQEQAAAKGLDYLDYTAFSRQGLIDQLVFEGFSAEDATFAVDYIAPDWNEQAAKKAQEYLDYSSFSRQGLIDQLVFEGFTQAEAEYGVQAVGY